MHKRTTRTYWNTFMFVRANARGCRVCIGIARNIWFRCRAILMNFKEVKIIISMSVPLQNYTNIKTESFTHLSRAHEPKIKLSAFV
jgi:hypothetical protein